MFRFIRVVSLFCAVLIFVLSALTAAEPEVRFLDFHTGDVSRYGGIRELCSTSGIKWQTVSPADLENRKLLSEVGKVLLIPESEHFPVSAVEGLDAYLQSGGSVIFTGNDRPFTSPAIRDGGRMLTMEAFFQMLKDDPRGRDAGLVENGLKYRRQCPVESASSPSSATLSKDGKTLRVRVENYSRWETWITADGTVSIPADTEYLRVRARGDAPGLSIELGEKDGSRWIASCPLKNEWDTYLLPVDAFTAWASPHREKEGDRVRFENVRKAVIGLSDTHTKGVEQGKSYTYEFECPEALPGTSGSGPRNYPPGFSLEGIAPKYKSYILDGPVTLTGDGRHFEYSGNVVSPVPRMTGLGITMQRPWRFIPIVTARNEQGGRGYPVWIMLQLERRYKGAVVAGTGFSLETILKEPELSERFVGLVKRLSVGAFLAGGGPADFVADVGTTVRYGAEVFRSREGMKVRCRILDGNGSIVDEFEKPAEISCVAEFKPVKPGVHRCTTELVDSQGRIVDRIESEIIVADGKPDTDFIRTEKDNFISGGEKWYPNGVNFYPIYSVAGMDAGDYRSGWGDRRFYDPALVEEAVLDARSAGLNMLSVHPSDNGSLDPRAIRDLLYRCRKHGMKLNLFVGAASPLNFREEELRRLIEEARLRDDSSLFCYDIIWEATNHVYRKDSRERFRPEWNRWLEGQYGSSAEAVNDWGFDPGSDEKGRIAPPSDDQFKNDGDHRVFVAVYRRFMDDHTAQLWQRAVDRLRRLDPNHLITNRAGNIHPFDNGFSGPVKALDFISPEGYTIRQDKNGEGAVGFATRIMDFYSDGKPIVWSEFGKSVSGSDFTPVDASVEQYGDYNELFYRRGLEAGAQGFAPWWWPGGYRVNERSDFGITNVDGTLRRPAEVAKAYAERIRTPRNRLAGDVPFDFNPDASAGGYPELVFGSGGEAYLAAATEGGMLQIRTKSTGKTSVDVPIEGVGNVPYNGRNPVRYLNGLFEKVEYKDAAGRWIEIEDMSTIRHSGRLELRTKIANMGTVPFVAEAEKGGVFVRVEHDGRTARFPLENDLPRLRDAVVTNIVIPADRKGTFSFRFEAKDRAVFGEEFRFTVDR